MEKEKGSGCVLLFLHRFHTVVIREVGPGSLQDVQLLVISPFCGTDFTQQGRKKRAWVVQQALHIRECISPVLPLIPSTV